MIPQVRRGSTAVLEHYAPDGVPTSATVAIYAGGTALVAAGTAATIDTVSTTATGSAGTSTLTLASASGVTPGRSYWLQTSVARGQAVTVVDLASTAATLRQRLTFATSGATFKGHRITYSWTTLSSTYRDVRVDWSYTVNGAAVVRSESYDVVRWPFSLDIAKATIEEACPLYGDMGDSLQDYQLLRDRAERDIYEWLTARAIHPDLVRARRLLESAAVYRVLQLRLEMAPDRVDVGPWQAEFKAALSQFETSRAWYDTDDDAERAYATPSADGSRDRNAGEVVPIRYMTVG